MSATTRDKIASHRSNDSSHSIQPRECAEFMGESRASISDNNCTRGVIKPIFIGLDLPTGTAVGENVCVQSMCSIVPRAQWDSE